MYDGTIKPVQDIVAGDLLMGDDGTPREVLKLARGQETMYRVEQSCGHTFECNESHILSLKDESGQVVNLTILDYLDTKQKLFGYNYLTNDKSSLIVTKLGIDDYYGFSIDGNRLFCLSDGTVLHNTVQSEELKGQVGERLYSAFQLAAKAMNKTTSELNGMLQSGEVMATDLLPKLATEIDKTFGVNAIKNVQTMAGGWSRATDQLKLFLVEIAKTNGIDSFFTKTLNGIADVTKAMRVSGKGGFQSEIEDFYALDPAKQKQRLDELGKKVRGAEAEMDYRKGSRSILNPGDKKQEEELERRIAYMKRLYGTMFMAIREGERNIVKATKAPIDPADLLKQKQDRFNLLTARKGGLATEGKNLNAKDAAELAKLTRELERATEATKKFKAVKNPGVPFGDVASLKRLEGFLESTIQVAGGKGVDEQVRQLAAVRSQIEKMQALTSKDKKLNISGIGELTGTGTPQRLISIVENFEKIAKVSPFLFKDTGFKAMLTELERGAPTLDFYRNSIKQIENQIAELTKAGKIIPPELIKQLADFKKVLQESEAAASSANAQTNTGASGADDAKWIQKAEARIAKMKAAGKEIKQTAEEMAKGMKDAHEALMGQSANIMQGVGESIGTGIQKGFENAENPLKTALRLILNMLADFMIKIGTAMLVGGTLLEAAQVAVPFLKPLMASLGLDGASAAIAGGALVVGGGLVKGLTAMEDGGLATGPTLALIGESTKARMGGGELVTSVDQGTQLIAKGLVGMGAFGARTPQSSGLKAYGGGSMGRLDIGGEFTIRGTDLIHVVSRALKTSQTYGIRQKGDNPFGG